MKELLVERVGDALYRLERVDCVASTHPTLFSPENRALYDQAVKATETLFDNLKKED